jgi:ArsR family transcriptional regulator
VCRHQGTVLRRSRFEALQIVLIASLARDEHGYQFISNFIEIIIDSDTHFDIYQNMKTNVSTGDAVSALAALAQEHRLALFRLLVQAGSGGMPAGALAEALGVPNSSLSFHLAHLNRARLIEQRREGRSLIYTANYDAMNALVGFLTENCCGGADCAPVPSEVEGPAISPPKQARKSA